MSSLWIYLLKLMILWAVTAHNQTIIIMIFRHNILQKVKNIRISNCLSNIRLLKCPSFICNNIVPWAVCKLQNEHYTRFWKYYRRFSRYHSDILIRFHNLLNSCKRELVEFKPVLQWLVIYWINFIFYILEPYIKFFYKLADHKILVDDIDIMIR